MLECGFWEVGGVTKVVSGVDILFLGQSLASWEQSLRYMFMFCRLFEFVILQ